MNESDIFLAAVQIEDPAVRAAFLDSVCREKPDQLARIVARIERYGKWIGAWDGFSNRLVETFVEISAEQPAIGPSASETEQNTLPIGSEWMLMKY